MVLARTNIMARTTSSSDTSGPRPAAAPRRKISSCRSSSFVLLSGASGSPSRLYKNLDIHTADNSAGAQALAGAALPGDVGANPISDTLPDWVIARMGNAGVDLPAFTTHPTAEPR
jgi:hypothetical protein